jgi:hypothetical protein
VVRLEQPPAPGPWVVLRDTLDACARAQGITGGFNVHISVDEDGRAGDIWSDPGNGFTDCLGGQLSRTRFPKHFQNRTIEIPFVTPP